MITYLFAGQGINISAKELELFKLYPDEMAQADEILGFSMERSCAENDPRLTEPEYLQPQIFLLNALAFRAQVKEGNLPDFCLGHSLGEFNALEAMHVISFADALRLVSARGKAMQQAPDGRMCAVCGDDPDSITSAVNECGKKYNITAANFNSPKQIVISGSKDNIEKSIDILTDMGFLCIILNVEKAFHSQYMQEANIAFTPAIDQLDFSPDNTARVISCITGEPYMNDIRPTLKKHMVSSVHWIDAVSYLKAIGCNEFVQVGQGHHLLKFVRDISKYLNSQARE